MFANNTSIQLVFDRGRLNTQKAFPCLLFFFLFGSILESFSGFLSRIGVGESSGYVGKFLRGVGEYSAYVGEYSGCVGEYGLIGVGEYSRFVGKSLVGVGKYSIFLPFGLDLVNYIFDDHFDS